MLCGNKYCIIHLVGKTHGGVAVMAKTLIKEQLKNGHTIIAVFFDYDEDFLHEFEHQLSVLIIKERKFPGLNVLLGMGIRKLYKYAKEKYPALEIVIHAHNAVTIGLLPRLRNIPIVCTLHGKSIWKRESIRKYCSEYMIKHILRKVVKFNGQIIAVSKATAEYFAKYTKFPISVIYNGTIRNTNQDRIVFKEDFIVGHIGGISYSKGWDTAINGFSLFTKQVKINTLFVSAGSIFINESEINCLLDGSDVKNRVKILGLVKDAGNRLIPSLDVLVLPSVSEGLPMSIIEAISYGVPVITTDVGGIKEIIIDGDNGYIVEKNAMQIAARLQELAINKEQYQKMSKNAIDIYSMYFSADIMQMKYYQVYDKLSIS